MCDAASATPGLLWPPEHQFIDITVAGVTDPDGDPIVITIDSIFQDEEVIGAGSGSGNTAPDGLGVGTSVASVRSERNGNPSTPGNGRVYHIGFSADDGQGATCSGTVSVCVPHDQSVASCSDGGPLFDSTELTLEGVAAGGTICADIATDSGEVHAVCVASEGGQTGGQVIQTLVGAINGNAALAAQGVFASASAGSLLIETGGFVADAFVADSGFALAIAVPALSSGALATMALLMLATTALFLQQAARRRR